MLLKNKISKNILLKILLIISIPLAILSIIIMIYSICFITKEDDEQICNIADIDFEYLDMYQDFYHYDKLGYKSVIGVDLSEHNQKVDFIKLKDQGIEYAFLRLGWRGYYEPVIHLDIRFEEYYKLAKEAGIKIGVYFFSQAINEEEAIEEANFVIETLKNKKIDTYVVYDCETITEKNVRTGSLSKKQTTLDAKAFLTTISEAGYNPMLYTNYDWTKNFYEHNLLNEYPVWYAQYSKSPQYQGKYIIWQYATEMVLDGVSGKDGVDLNLMIIKEDIS